MENKVDVQINGIRYTLLTDASEDHIKEIAAYVEKKINEVKSESLGYNRELVLASLNIADDLFNVGHKFQALREESREALENYPGLVESQQKILGENEQLLARIEQIQTDKESLEASNKGLSLKLEALKSSEKSEGKLQNEIKRLQKEIMTLKAENEQLKEKI